MRCVKTIWLFLFIVCFWKFLLGFNGGVRFFVLLFDFRFIEYWDSIGSLMLQIWLNIIGWFFFGREIFILFFRLCRMIFLRILFFVERASKVRKMFVNSRVMVFMVEVGLVGCFWGFIVLECFIIRQNWGFGSIEQNLNQSFLIFLKEFFFISK